MTVTHRSQSSTGTQRDAWVEINLAALERNIKKIQEVVKTDIMAVVKADAYGHGSTTLAPIIQSLGVSSFGVATVDEGIALRKCGIKVPILILGATPFWSYESCIENNLTITIYSKEQINNLIEIARNENKIISTQLKIDTGMSRLGVSYEEAPSIIKDLLEKKEIKLEGVFSHLSHAEDLEFSTMQKERFDDAIKGFKDLKISFHIANSHAAINYPDFRYNLVRCGIAIYGQEYNFLEPIISLKGRITRIHKVKKGEFVSYERTWRADKDSTIATVPIGYADGVARNLSNNFSGTCKDTKIKQVGNISMDQMMFDITGNNEIKVNDIVTLIDKEHPISKWAKELKTITYELICRLKIRLPRVYTRN